MAELIRKRQGEILSGVLAVLAEGPDGLEARKVIAELERRMELRPFEDAEYPNRPGVRRFPKHVRFTTINAVKAGWLVKEDGVWTLTDAGAAARQAYPDPEQLMREAVRLYGEWKKGQADSGGDDGAVGVEDGAVGVEDGAVDVADVALRSVTVEEARETALGEIRAHLQELDPYDFQDLVAALLRAMGYHVVWVAPRGADGGLDILAQSDPLGTEGPRIKGQVKRRKDKAGADELRSFISLLGAHDVGVFISLGGFTSEAEALARTQETRRITLLGLGGLLDLWIENQSKIAESDRPLLPLTPVWYLTTEG